MDGDQLDMDSVLQAIDCLKDFKLNQQKQDDVKSGLFSDSGVLHLHVILKKIPSSSKDVTPIVFSLPFPYRTAVSTCLFTKDLDKDKWNPDVDKDSRVFRDYFSSEGIACFDHVISLRQLKREFKTYEAKRGLCTAYDVFLCDDRVLRQVSRNLGKSFHESKKLPFPIRLTRGKLQDKVRSVLNSSRFVVKNRSTRCSAAIGNLEQESTGIAANVAEAFQNLKRKLPGGLDNIRSMYLSIIKSPHLPVYVNLDSSNFVTLPAPVKKNNAPIIDELTTTEGDEVVNVKIYPDGRSLLFDSNMKELKPPVREAGFVRPKGVLGKTKKQKRDLKSIKTEESNGGKKPKTEEPLKKEVV